MDFISSKVLEYSSITEADYVSLATFFLSQTNENFNCDMCLSRFCHRSDAEAMDKKWRTAKGCFDVSEKPKHSLIDKSRGITIDYLTCPGNLSSPSDGHLFSMLDVFEKGTMPFPGCYSDQPAKVVEAFNVIVNLREQHNKDMEEREKKAQNRLNKKGGRRGGR